MPHRAWTSARFTVPLPEGHRFPIAKYAAIRNGVVARGVLPAGAIMEPDGCRTTDLRLVHTERHVQGMLDGTLGEREIRRLGFPWSEGLRERSLRTAQGTVEAARDALETGLGINLAGGTHHAHADHGEGYCCFNDVAIALRVLQREGRLSRAAIIDLDVHQGNGTARIFAGDDDVFTFSMHGARNFPFLKATSRLDVELDDGTGDTEYLQLLDRHLGDVLEAARPELVVYLAGADPYVHDRLGRLGLSMEGLRARDARVFAACRARGLPVLLTLAGGYAERIEDIVAIHVATVAELLASHG